MAISRGQTDKPNKASTLTVKTMQNTRFKGVFNALFEITNGKSKGYEETKEVIKGWSPNNVRRVYIGVNEVGLQYYISKEGITKHVILPVKEFETFIKAVVDRQYDITKSKSVLLALTDRRQFTNLEAIIFTDGVSQASGMKTGSAGLANTLVSADVTQQVLGTLVKGIQSGDTWQAKMYYKFPRLTFLCYVPLPFDVVTKLGGTHLEIGGKNFCQVLSEKTQTVFYYKVPEKSIKACIERVSTYPSLYEMDKQIAEHLERAKVAYLSAQRTEKKPEPKTEKQPETKTEKKSETTLKQELKSFNVACRESLDKKISGGYISDLQRIDKALSESLLTHVVQNSSLLGFDMMGLPKFLEYCTPVLVSMAEKHEITEYAGVHLTGELVKRILAGVGGSTQIDTTIFKEKMLQDGLTEEEYSRYSYLPSHYYPLLNSLLSKMQLRFPQTKDGIDHITVSRAMYDIIRIVCFAYEKYLCTYLKLDVVTLEDSRILLNKLKSTNREQFKILDESCPYNPVYVYTTGGKANEDLSKGDPYLQLQYMTCFLDQMCSSDSTTLGLQNVAVMPLLCYAKEVFGKYYKIVSAFYAPLYHIGGKEVTLGRLVAGYKYQEEANKFYDDLLSNIDTVGASEVQGNKVCLSNALSYRVLYDAFLYSALALINIVVMHPIVEGYMTQEYAEQKIMQKFKDTLTIGTTEKEKKMFNAIPYLREQITKEAVMKHCTEDGFDLQFYAKDNATMAKMFDVFNIILNQKAWYPALTSCYTSTTSDLGILSHFRFVSVGEMEVVELYTLLKCIECLKEEIHNAESILDKFLGVL